jgi:inorganic pyrophosphatase
MNTKPEPTWELMSCLFQAHPWHGVSIGREQPQVVNVFIEVVPDDTIKYEMDKHTGHLRVDRPQAYSNFCPSLYGLIPQTLCGPEVAALCIDRTGRINVVGDEDALDICVLSEKRVPRGDILLEALPIGGLRVIDGNEADDKIIAVLKNDAVFGLWRDVDDCPESIIERLRHYFMTYKYAPGSEEATCEVVGVYNREEAYEVIRRARIDYQARFADVKALLDAMLVRYS